MAQSKEFNLKNETNKQLEPMDMNSEQSGLCLLFIDHDPESKAKIKISFIESYVCVVCVCVCVSH